MSWKDILKVADIGLHDLDDPLFDKENLFNEAAKHLEEFYEKKLKVLANGAFDESPYVIYVSDQIAEEIYKDKTLLDKLTLQLLDYYTWGHDKQRDVMNEKNEESLKKDTLDFFEEHLTQKKYVDLAKKHAKYYSEYLYGV